MSKYKVGDKVVLTVTGTTEMGGYPYYELNDNFNLWEQSIDNHSEPLTTYTEPLERKNENKQKQIEKLVDKLHRQAAEITRLLAENKELKEDFEKSKRVNLNMGRLAGQNEAWELARKIVLYDKDSYSGEELKEIFGYAYSQTLMKNYTYPEAAAKIAEWEAAKTKEEIKVGDIITHGGYDEDLCVLCMSTDKKYYNAVDRYGAVYYMLSKETIAKTGRHIDIGGFLKQIGGEE